MDASPTQAASNPRESLHSWLSYKRLESGAFTWPPPRDGAVTLNPAQLHRQTQMLAGQGVHLDGSTLVHWIEPVPQAADAKRRQVRREGETCEPPSSARPGG
jgi:transposase